MCNLISNYLVGAVICCPCVFNKLQFYQLTAVSITGKIVVKLVAIKTNADHFYVVEGEEVLTTADKFTPIVKEDFDMLCTLLPTLKQYEIYITGY